MIRNTCFSAAITHLNSHCYFGNLIMLYTPHSHSSDRILAIMALCHQVPRVYQSAPRVQQPRRPCVCSAIVFSKVINLVGVGPSYCEVVSGYYVTDTREHQNTDVMIEQPHYDDFNCWRCGLNSIGYPHALLPHVRITLQDWSATQKTKKPLCDDF